MEIPKVSMILIPSQVSEISNRTSNPLPKINTEPDTILQRTVLVRDDTILSKIELNKLRKATVSRVIETKREMSNPTSPLKAKINNPDIWKVIADKLLNNS